MDSSKDSSDFVSPRDVWIKMAEANKSNNLKDVLEVAEIKETANVESYKKTAIWADKLEIGSSNSLDGMMANFKLWNSSFRNKLIKRYCLYFIKNQRDLEDKISVVANKNVAMFLKKIVKENLLQMIEGATAFDSSKELVDITPDTSKIIRSILSEIPRESFI